MTPYSPSRMALTVRLLVLTNVLVVLVPVSAQLQTVTTPNELRPTRDVLGAVAAQRLTVSPAQLIDLIAAGLLDPAPEVREAALFAVTGHSGAFFVNVSPSRRGLWRVEHPTLVGLRGQIRQALRDSDEHVRAAAALALANLSYDVDSPDGGVTLGEETLATFVQAYRAEPSGFNRGEIMKFVSQCVDTSDTRRRLLLEAMNDSNERVINYALMGAAELRIPEALERIVGMLGNTSISVRLAAATALGRYGQGARPYLSRIRNALAGEQDSRVKGVLEAIIRIASNG